MEWVETTGETLEEAKEAALDQLGVAEDDAEFEVIEEPKQGLFGRTRGEARVRARVKPSTPRGKTERRPRREKEKGGERREQRPRNDRQRSERPEREPRPPREKVDVDPAVVGQAASEFLSGLVDACGTKGTVTVNREDGEIEVRVDGTELGLMVGPGGATLLAIQDLTRVASQRRLGDQDTRLRIDIAGYRERRREALSRFATKVADEVKETGSARMLEPMTSADRKIVHDTLVEYEGVTIIDPTTTWIDTQVKISPDVVIHPGSALSGKTIVGDKAIIGPRTTLVDCEVGSDATVVESFATKSKIGASAQVGPYTYLRQGTVLDNESKAGAFVEIKNSTVGKGSKVAHLSYVGDAQIGQESNIGAATVFVNYDGESKHQTKIGDQVRIGSDTMLVAPVTVGDGAYTAAGSVINEDVPAGALGVGRAKQVNILGWVLRKRKDSKSATAAKKAGAKE